LVSNLQFDRGYAAIGRCIAGALEDSEAAYNSGDYATALKLWRPLAAQVGTDAVKNRDALSIRMTPAQIAEAQRMAREWNPTPRP
jgi:hypothetical protein